jgi:hypothetical protein
MYLISWNKRGKEECIRVRTLDVALTVYDIIRETWKEMEDVGFYESVDPDTLRPEEKEEPDFNTKSYIQIEEPDCEYYRNMYGGICLAQKCAPRCKCCGIKERCDI